MLRKQKVRVFTAIQFRDLCSLRPTLRLSLFAVAVIFFWWYFSFFSCCDYLKIKVDWISICAPNWTSFCLDVFINLRLASIYALCWSGYTLSNCFFCLPNLFTFTKLPNLSFYEVKLVEIAAFRLGVPSTALKFSEVLDTFFTTAPEAFNFLLKLYCILRNMPATAVNHWPEVPSTAFSLLWTLLLEFIKIS